MAGAEWSSSGVRKGFLGLVHLDKALEWVGWRQPSQKRK